MQLSEGALADIYQGKSDIQKPIFQILGTKQLQNSNSERYRVVLSDGVTSTSFSMLAPQLNSLVKSDVLTENSIVQITRYSFGNANSGGKSKKIMLILGIEVKVSGDKVDGRIGNPSAEKSSGAGDQAGPSGTDGNSAMQAQKRSAPAVFNTSGSAGVKKRLVESLNAGMDIVVTPIAALTPYSSRWIIKARVIQKSDIRSWSNPFSEGKVWNMTLVDESGEIKCAGFTDSIDKFYNIVEVGNVYYITRAQLKVANKKFNTTNNDYEMTLTGDSEILLCQDNIDNVPKITYKFVQISDLAKCDKDVLVDILGVVKSAEPVQSLTSRTGKELHKRDLTLVDSSDTSIIFTLWGAQADHFEADSHPVIAAKYARINEYQGGKSLGVTQDTCIQIDLDIPEAQRLRDWFNSGGMTQEFTSLSKSTEGFNAELMLLQEAIEKALNNKEHNTICIVKATAVMLRSDRALYKSCPTESCKKKVIDQANGMFRCEKCDREYPNFKYSMSVPMQIADFSENQWVTVFTEEAEKILGVSSQELGELSANSDDMYRQKFLDAAFNNYILKLRMKTETFNDETKMKAQVLACQPVNLKQYNKHLLSEIRKLANMRIG